MKIELRKELYQGKTWYYIYIDHSIVFGTTRYSEALQVYNEAMDLEQSKVRVLHSKEVPIAKA